MHEVRTTLTQGGISSAQEQQVTMQSIHGRMRFELGPIQLAAFEGARESDVVELTLPCISGDGRELTQKLPPIAVRGRRELLRLIGEVEERMGRGKLLPLKKHRGGR